MNSFRIVGMVLVVAAVALVVVGVATLTLGALLLALLTGVLGALLLLRIGTGGDLFPAIRGQLDYRSDMKAAAARPGPVCWRCQHPNPPFSTECERCGATTTT